MYQQVTLIINATINKNTPQGPKKRRQCADVFEKKGIVYVIARYSFSRVDLSAPIARNSLEKF